jgi:hypothetical protein
LLDQLREEPGHVGKEILCSLRSVMFDQQILHRLGILKFFKDHDDLFSVELRAFENVIFLASSSFVE